MYAKIFPVGRFAAFLFLSWVSVWTAIYANAQSDLPEYTIHRAAAPMTLDGHFKEPSWAAAKTVGDFLFPWWTKSEKEQTQARLLWDDHNLYVGFIAYDRHISATVTERDGPVSNDDCVEVFIAPNPDEVKDYFNFEINALGTILDRSPLNHHSSKWNAEGIQIAITYNGTLNDELNLDHSWTTEIAIPFKNFSGFSKHTPPSDGDVWRLNLYRIGGRINPQFSLWSDTRTPQPNYHVPERFGIVRFSTIPVTSGDRK